jgi:putative membrane protein
MFKFAVRFFVLSYTLLISAGAGLSADTKTSNSKLSHEDSEFVTEAAQGGLMEVQLGKLAQDKASNERVKEFGKRMEQDHGRSNTELQKMASDKGIQLSTDLDKKHKSKVDKLALSGANFDRQYMQDMISDHKDDIKKFQRASDKGKDGDLKSFASQALPTLKEHLQMAENTSREIKSAGKNANTTSNR